MLEAVVCAIVRSAGGAMLDTCGIFVYLSGAKLMSCQAPLVGLPICIYAPVKEWQKRATLGAVFGSPSPSPSGATYFGPSSFIPKMDLSRSTLRVMARGIYGALSLIGLRALPPLDVVR